MNFNFNHGTNWLIHIGTEVAMFPGSQSRVILKNNLKRLIDKEIELKYIGSKIDSNVTFFKIKKSIY